MPPTHAPPRPLHADPGAYLRSSTVIDAGHGAVVALARQLTAGIRDDTGKARAIYEWLQREVPHSHDAGREEVTCAASEVLALRTGICFAQSHLVAALLRAAGLAAGFCYQVIDADGTLHGLNAVQLGEPAGWVRIDARGRAPFAADGTSLAYPDAPFLDAFVYPEPLPHVVRALRAHATLTGLWRELPTAAGARDPASGTASGTAVSPD